jgi:hypothetical protein
VLFPQFQIMMLRQILIKFRIRVSFVWFLILLPGNHLLKHVKIIKSIARHGLFSIFIWKAAIVFQIETPSFVV